MPRDVDPGVERDNRISDQGLKRLERQLQSGAAMSKLVRNQWLARYGEPARELFRKFGLDIEG